METFEKKRKTTCMVVTCKNRGYIPGVTYFFLTKARRSSWMIALGRDPSKEVLSETNAICIDHFAPEDVFISGQKTMLRKGAVPKLKLGPRKPEQYRRSLMENQGEELPGSYKKPEFEPLFEPVFIGESRPTMILSQENNVVDVVSDERTTQELGVHSSVIPEASPLPALGSSYDMTEFTSPPVAALPTTSGTVKRTFDHIQSSFASSSTDSEGLKGLPKKIRRDVRTFHNYCLSPRTLKRSLSESMKKRKSLSLELSKSKRKMLRLKQKISHLRDVVQHLKRTRSMSSDALSVLEATYSGIPLEIMKRTMANVKNVSKGKGQTRKKFPPELRSFAMTLQFYSSKAYNYVRRTFQLALPSPSVIRNWLTSVNCEPGFTQCSFDSLRAMVAENRKNEKETLCSLMLDEMAIRKQIEYVGKKTWGYVDIGTGTNDDSLECASEALVLMVVSLNSNWKIPIGYFFIKSLTGVEKANIVRHALIKLKETGVTITSVTCDGPSAHFAMATHLGADIKDVKKTAASFLSSN